MPPNSFQNRRVVFARVNGWLIGTVTSDDG
jgi:hypothetical protein